MKVKIKHEVKNDWLFMDNHPENNVYCPFCGKNLNTNIFTDEGYGESMNSGVECKDCGIQVYTYKVEKLK